MRAHQPGGLTLLEVLIAMFILMVGIVGVMAALPTGINSAHTVILQDNAIHLAHSKFAEFRRDKVDPATDLIAGSPYLSARHEPFNSSPPGDWRDFAHAAGDHYQHYDSIERYEWKVTLTPIKCSPTNTPAAAGTEIGLSKVTLTVHEKGIPREFTFVQYLCAYK